MKPVVYGNETWAMTAVDMKRWDMWEGNMLRMMFGPMVEQGIWRRIDQEWGELIRDLDILKRKDWNGLDMW